MTDTQSTDADGITHLIISPDVLQDETLDNLAKEFVLREQANDCDSEFDLEAGIAQAKQLIKKGELLITFDPKTESVGVLFQG